MDKRHKLERKMIEKSAEINKIRAEIGREASQPLHVRSEAKIYNWGRDAERLQADYDALHKELCDLIESPKYKAELDEKIKKLIKKRDGIAADLAATNLVLTHLANDAILDVSTGGDPLDWAQKEAILKEQAATLARAVYFTNQAMAHLTRPVPTVYHGPAEWIGRLPKVEPHY
jgi:hypothetical protein